MSDKRKSAAASLHPDGHGHAHGNFGYHDHDEDTPMGHSHSHGGAPPHEHPNSPGRYPHREEEKSRRDYIDRAFTVGIGGPVGSGKTALVLSLCRAMREKYGLVVVTNDIFTKEDCEFLVKHDALPNGRIKAVETGGCPHAAIPGGDKVPRKGGPGITQSDLLIINKADLAELVGADLVLMSQQAHDMREGGPVVLAQVKHMVGIPAIIDHIIAAWTRCTGKAPKHVMSTAPTTATTTTSTRTISSEAPAPAPPSMDMNDDMDSRKKTRVA